MLQAAWLSLTLLALPGTASSAETVTAVAGSWVNGVSCAPTNFDPTTGATRCAGSSTWQGAWTGVTVYEVQGVSDPDTGDFAGTITEKFTGTYLRDHSRGSLDLIESLIVDGATGGVRIEARIVRGTGDLTFRCSSGQVTFDGFAAPGNLLALGGWHGQWSHGCAGA